MFRHTRISFYNGVTSLVALPPYNLKNTNNDIIVPFLLNVRAKQPDVISTVPPRRIDNNCMFIIDLSKIDHPEDVFSDELGVWKQTETSKKKYTARKSDDGFVKQILVSKCQAEDQITVVRRPFVNKSDNTLRKVVVSINDVNGQYNLVFVKYEFSGASHKIVVKPHGN